ncbi:COBRA-like protein 7 isoform X2 [Punica granatum]|uniref:COBRA-like protein 7 isoform X2 n=2 Tax=Punica granatum TaxID=22663 RepID=A0A6P8ES01_PUNGR|nr:COBRA-like protein 7 isoform X2 [Punica granatum]PKI40165.1 hypothetical protein CRG98_039417 [Punica granatum]
MSYNYTGGREISPTNPANQPYRFESTLTVQNNGLDELKSWQVFIGFQHDEILVSADTAILADGTSLPARVGNGTTLAGFPDGDLETAVETAGDLNHMQAVVQLVGTQFKVTPPNIPLPANITLMNEGYSCPNNYTMQGNTTMEICCNRSSSLGSNPTSNKFLPRQKGDLIIMYDVTRVYDTNYFAQVTISNHNPLGRLENWMLSWEWARDEFIYSMKGAYPYVVDTSECVFGEQGKYYKELDFSQAMNCERNPAIVDLPLEKANDTNLGLVPSCCRNGTLLPPSMDLEKSVSAFQMQVFKMPPDLNRSEIVPPHSWRINGTMSSTYECGSPVPVSPSQFPSSLGLPSKTSAISSWQVVCNITRPQPPPKCCVSFSAFYNDSVIPCNTCACGCANVPSNTCSASAPALLLEPPTLLLPSENRTEKALAWAELKRRPVPDPLPCWDNCGVSINWHLLSDYRNGWTARLTIFNWGDTPFPDWYTAVQLDQAGPGFEEAYSFNGSLLSSQNNTIFMKGLSGQAYILAETDGKNPKKDPRIPGTQQSVILFTKKTTPNINIVHGDGFPTKVTFNGEECAIPTILPSNIGYKMRSAGGFSIFLSIMLIFLS